MDTEKTSGLFSSPKLKKVVRTVFSVLFCAVTFFCAVSAFFVLYAALSKQPENTVQIFGYKIFCSGEDIKGTAIKKGSAVIVKNTGNDDFYTPQSLSGRSVFVIKGLGACIQDSPTWIAFCFSVPPMAVFVTVIFVEMRKKLAAKEGNELCCEIEIEEAYDGFEQPAESKK